MITKNKTSTKYNNKINCGKGEILGDREMWIFNINLGNLTRNGEDRSMRKEDLFVDSITLQLSMMGTIDFLLSSAD